MLGKSYIKINNIAVPNPVSLDLSFSPVEKTSESEAGTDIVQMIRSSKMSGSATMNCSSYWADRFESYCRLSDVELTINGKIYHCRLRKFKKTLVENSEMTYGTDGLWKVSLNILEI